MWFAFASASAICFGLRGILYHWTAQRPIDRNLLLFAVYLSGAIIALSVNLIAGQSWSYGAWMGISMGLFSFISNTSMYRGFAVGKASMVAVFTALPPVVVVIIAFLIWGEMLNLWQSLSFIIIIAGVLMIRYSNDLSIKNLKGAQWGALAMLGFGLTDLSSKQATLLGGQTMPTLAVMYGTGTLLFGASWLAAEWKRKAVETLTAAASEQDIQTSEQPAQTGSAIAAAKAAAGPAASLWSVPRTLLWGLVVGLTNISGMMLIMPAFRLGVTGLVSAVIAMNVVFVLLYARFGLKERFSPLEVSGLTCACAGILILRLAG